VRGSTPLLLALAWLVFIAVVAALFSALAGIRWWVSLAAALGAAVVFGASAALFLRRPK